MTKVTIKNENITSFGGIYCIMDVLLKLSSEKLIKSVLGRRGGSGKAFSHGSIFGSLSFSYLCGGGCLKDINVFIGQLRQRLDTLLSGTDVVGRGLKELAEENIVYRGETSNKPYSFSMAEKSNTLLLRAIRRMGLIEVGDHVGLNFNHQFISAHRFDTKYSYKQDFGYLPGWASIRGIIVGGENRDGNTNVRLRQEDTLCRIMDRITSELSMVIERFLIDCESFPREAIQTVGQCYNTFYIRAANCGSQRGNFHRLKGWKNVEVGYERCDVTSTSVDNLIEGKLYRLVIQQSPLEDKDGKEQTDMLGVIYTYRCILTNSWTSTEEDTIIFYNEREASERNFSTRNNGLDRSHLPFSFTTENMVFMMIITMLKDFHLYLIHHISEKVRPLKKAGRQKASTLHFISAPIEWIRTGGQNVLGLYTNKTYYSEVFLK